MTMECLAEPVADATGAWTISAPAVGYVAGLPRDGAMIAAGQPVGTLMRVGKTVAIVLPAGVAGRVDAVRFPDPVAAVVYGQVLFSIVACEDAAERLAEETTAPDAAVDAGLIEITSPTMGTFYRRPNPSSPAFAEEGAILQPGSPLGLVEVMKVFNPIGWTGTGPVEIAEILASDGQEVVAGNVLARVRPLNDAVQR